MRQQGSSVVDSGHILQTATGFWSSKVLLTAVEMKVFTTLGGRRVSGAELGRELGLHPRGISDFLDALTAMKFLEREGNGTDARYYNTPAGAMYLDANSPRYLGGILEMLNARLYKFWHDLPDALRTGKPQNEIKHSQKPMFEELYSDLPRLEQFMGAMTGVVISGNVILLIVFWELTSLVSFLLIGYWHQNTAARDGARMALLVTGAGGFIGACLARALIQEGHDVHLLLRPQTERWRLAGRLGEAGEEAAQR